MNEDEYVVKKPLPKLIENNKRSRYQVLKSRRWGYEERFASECWKEEDAIMKSWLLNIWANVLPIFCYVPATRHLLMMN
jgi:hypothetical protein